MPSSTKRTRDNSTDGSTSTSSNNTADPTFWTVVNGKVKKPKSLLTRQRKSKKRRKEKRTTTRFYYSSFLYFCHYHYRNDLNKFDVIKTYWDQNYENPKAARRKKKEDSDGNILEEYEDAVVLLRKVTNVDVLRYLCVCAYGKPIPGASDCPIYARDATIASYKKQISTFMFSRANYDDERLTGNPTMSEEINDLVKTIKKAQTKGLGSESKKTRPFETSEFKAIMEISRSIVSKKDTIEKAYTTTAMWAVQRHAIRRNDDMCMLDVGEIAPHRNQLGALQMTITWSKNISTENRIMPHIILAHQDMVICPIIAVGGYVGVFEDPDVFTIHAGREGLSSTAGRDVGENVDNEEEGETVETPDEPGFFRFNKVDCVKTRHTSERLKVITKEKLKMDGRTGTHGHRKEACDKARRAGDSKEYCDFRGGWTPVTSSSGSYHRVLIPWPDAKVAYSLTLPGGPVRYEIENYVPTMCTLILPAARNLVPGVGKILTAAVVYCSKSDFAGKLLPPKLIQRINSYETIHGEITVKKINIMINNDGSGNDCAQFIDIVNSDNADNTDNGTTVGGETLVRVKQVSQQLNHLGSRMTALERRVEKNDLQTRRQLNNISNSMQRMIMFRSGNRQFGSNVVAKLSDVKTLDILWQEYVSGINGYKPASQFTSAERGKVKSTFSRRKVFWSSMIKLLSYGIDATVLIERLESIYGNDRSSVTMILSNMQKDKTLTKYFEKHPLNA
jgi:hypothetical protein